MIKVLNENPVVVWLILTIVSCLAFLFVIAVAEILLAPRGKKND